MQELILAVCWYEQSWVETTISCVHHDHMYTQQQQQQVWLELTA